MGAFDTYQALVGYEQGGNRLWAKDGGYLNFYDTDFAPQRLKYQILSFDTITRYSTVSDASALSAATALTSYGYVMLRGLSDHVSTNINMGPAYAGARMMINGSEIISNCLIVVQCSLTSVAVYGPGGSKLSSLVFDGSIGSPKIKLVCATADIWTVVDVNNATLQYNA